MCVLPPADDEGTVRCSIGKLRNARMPRHRRGAWLRQHLPLSSLHLDRANNWGEYSGIRPGRSARKRTGSEFVCISSATADRSIHIGGGQDRDRTCDPYHVKVVLSRRRRGDFSENRSIPTAYAVYDFLPRSGRRGAETFFECRSGLLLKEGARGGMGVPLDPGMGLKNFARKLCRFERGSKVQVWHCSHCRTKMRNGEKPQTKGERSPSQLLHCPRRIRS
jgi:hypothetical protein